MQIRRALTTAAAATAALALTTGGVIVAAPAAQAAFCAPGVTPTPAPSPTSTSDPEPCNPISVQISDAPASVGLASDWNAFTVTITNNGDSEEVFSERALGFFATIGGSTALTPDDLDVEVEVDESWEPFDLSQDGTAVAARVELPNPGIGSGESEEFTVRFRVGAAHSGDTEENFAISPLTSLSFDLRLATFGDQSSEGELIGSDDVTVGVKPLTINTSSAVKPVLGVPVTMTTTTTNNTGSHYGTVVTAPLWVLDEGEGDDAPDTLRKVTRHLRTMAQQTRTRIEVRAPAGTWIDLADTDLELHEMPFVTETLRNGHAFSVEWRFTFNDPSVIGTDKSITWASLALNLGWSLGPELRRSVRGGGSSNALLEEAAYFVGVARTALGIVPGTTPPAATPTPSATPPAQGESPAADNDDDSDQSGDDDRHGDDENGGVAPTGLADTGANSNEYVAFAAMLLLAGAAIMIGTRRREGAHQ